MKKFFDLCKKVAIFSAGALLGAALENGFSLEIAYGWIMCILVYGLAHLAARNSAANQ